MSSLMMGVLFAAGWTPCIGTTLGAILTLGLSQESSGQAMILSAGYALGLAITFLALGLGTEKVIAFLIPFRRHIRTIEIISGLLLILIGIIMLFNQTTMISLWALRNGLYFNLNFKNTSIPFLAVSVIAGLFSFL